MDRRNRKAPTKKRTFAQELPCSLTKTEKEEFGQKLATIDAQLDNLTDEKKRVVSEFKTKIDGLELERRTTYEAITSGTVKRMVDCREDRDFARNRVAVFRTDTNEQITERAMTGDERDELAQGELPVDEHKNSEPAEV
jgi:hypothetical protein